MARLARRPVRLDAMHASPRPWAYRSRLTLTIRRHGGATRIGLRHRARPDDVFTLVECPITEPALVDAWREVQLAAACLPAGRTLSGVMRRDGPDIAFQLNGGDAWPLAEAFVRACPSLHRVTWRPEGGRERVIVAGDADARPLGAFAQVNPEVARQLHQAVVQQTLALAPASVVDAYAGSGATAVPLARAGVRVAAIEWDRAAVEHLRAELPEPSQAVCARVEDVLAAHLPADVVLLNPSREGVHKHVCEVLSAQRPRAMVYVSCDPATLARDLTRLEAFTITRLEAFDMFPQTAHVETMCVLERLVG